MGRAEFELIFIMNRAYLFFILLLLFASCTGNERYYGTWKALNMKGEKLEITFKEKSLSIAPLNSKSITTPYSQIGIGLKYGNQRFLFRLKGGKDYYITIPNKDNPRIALIEAEIDEDNVRPMFSLCKDSFLNHEKLEQLLYP